MMKTPGKNSIKLLLKRHLQVCAFSLGQLWATPLSSLLIIAVLGITLSLPMGLHVLLDNVRGLSDDWDGGTQISLFLEDNIKAKQVLELRTKMSLWPEINQIEHITSQQALDEFKALSGFGQILEQLDSNPLPHVLVVHPVSSGSGLVKAEALLNRLQKEKGVSLAQLDLKWLKRLHSIVDIAHRAVLVLSVLLGLAVLLIVGNTIRLTIHSKREEIELNKLVGATDAFIRRPFLYMGAWSGFGGACVAWLIVSLALLLLKKPTNELLTLYHSAFQLSSLNGQSTLYLLVFGISLGLLGAWMSVNQHLKDIQPR